MLDMIVIYYLDEHHKGLAAMHTWRHACGLVHPAYEQFNRYRIRVAKHMYSIHVAQHLYNMNVA